MSWQGSTYHYQWWRPFCPEWLGPKTWRTLPEAGKHARRVRSLWLMHDDDLAPHGPEFARLRHLRYLHLQGPVDESKPFALPAEIGQLTELRELLLLNHPLREVPAWLFDLPRLRYLMIRGTDITELPAAVARLRHLAVLRLENCQLPLSSLPASLRQLTALRQLSLRDTRIVYLPVEHLPPGLQRLDLSASAEFGGVDFEALRLLRPRLRITISGGR